MSGNRKPLQFTLGGIFVVTTLAAFGVWLVTPAGEVVGVLLGVLALFTMAVSLAFWGILSVLFGIRWLRNRTMRSRD